MTRYNYYLYKGNVYKWLVNSQHYLMMTGWDKKSNRDRRVMNYEIEKNKLEKINSNKALELINSYWNSGIRTWMFNGIEYDNSCTDISHCIIHKFKHTYINKTNNVEHSYFNCYKIVWHQGHIYWTICEHHYYPRIILYKFTDIKTEPTSNDFVKWTSFNNCRGIVNLNDSLII